MSAEHPELDEEEDDEVDDLASVLGLESPPKPEKPRFYCAGARRIDEVSGKRMCNHKAHRRWYDYCPACLQPFACLPYKREKGAASIVTLGKDTMDKHKAMVYYSTGIPELDRVLGGGVVYGKVVLVGAPRGSGKTSMLLAAANGFAVDGRKSIFASGEMDAHTNIDYAKRMGIANENLSLICDPEGLDVEDLCEKILQFGARLTVIDSAQLCIVSDMKKADIGSAAMIDAAINILSSFAQKKRRAVVIIGHLTKNQDFAGSEKTQHLVDALLRMEVEWGEPASPGGKPVDTMLRRLSMDGKSRQGRTDLTSLLELTSEGMRPPSVQALRKLPRGIGA